MHDPPAPIAHSGVAFHAGLRRVTRCVNRKRGGFTTDSDVPKREAGEDRVDFLPAGGCFVLFLARRCGK